jgi:allantoinase
MHETELVIRGRRVVTEHSVGPASVHITRGYISSISIFEDVPGGAELIEAAPESVVMPGLVDTHVHVNEPGRTDWEDLRPPRGPPRRVA